MKDGVSYTRYFIGAGGVHDWGNEGMRVEGKVVGVQGRRDEKMRMEGSMRVP